MQATPEIPALVVSHERSGTHFLMNALAAEFGYVDAPFFDFDQRTLKFNFFDTEEVVKFFNDTQNDRVEVIRKSHHEVTFFAQILSQICDRIRVFYIYRDPRDVAHSFRHFLNAWKWFEGPRVETPSAFIRTAPAGHMLRYQYHQALDMLERWRVHVDGWLDAAEAEPRITVVRFEDLRDRYDATLDAIAESCSWTRQYGVRPQRDISTVLTSQSDSPTNVWSDEDLDYMRARIGPTMRRLGYEI